MAFERDFIAFKNAVWGGLSGRVSITVTDEDLSGADFAWAFSATEGASADITLTDEAAGTEGISATYDPDFVDPQTRVVVGGTVIVPQIDQDTLEGLTFAVADDLELVHTLYYTPLGGSKTVLCFGKLTVKQGAENT